jgi:tetratricopeptide (TPR) repeat protein
VTRAHPENTPARIWYATLLSYALTDAGEYERARDVIRSALTTAETDVDPYTRVRLYWSAARLAHLEGRGSDALENIREAIALLKATDDEVTLARAYLLSAGVETNVGEAVTARGHLEKAELLLAASGTPEDRGMIQIGYSRVAYLEGNSGLAVETARTAIDTLGESHAGEQGEAVWALARGLWLRGDVEDSGQAFARAVDLLSVHGRRHDAARAAADWAEMLGNAGRREEAAKASERAAALGLDLDMEAARRT